MGEIEELRAKAIASMATSSTSANPNLKNPSKPREEGELSPSENDVQEIPTTSAAGATEPVEAHVRPTSKPVQISKREKRASSASSGDTQLRTSVRQNYNKNPELKQGPPKPGNRFNPSWHAPSVPNDNLVIRFSDDSESDSEDQTLERISERKVSSLRADGDRRPPTSSQLEPKYLQHNSSSQMKRIPRKGSFSRKFILPTNKVLLNSSRGSGLIAEKGSSIQNSNPLNKTTARHDHGFNQHTNLNINDLERLRQQIAIKENQLKLQLKSAQQSTKRTTSDLNQGHNGVDKNAASKKRLASADTVRSSSAEPERKHIKFNEPQCKVTPDVHQVPGPATKSVHKLKMPLPETIGPQDKNLHCIKEIPPEAIDLISDGQHGNIGKQIVPRNLVSRVKDGKSSLEAAPSVTAEGDTPNKQGDFRTSDAGINTNFSQFEKSIRIMDSSFVGNPNSQLVAQITSRADEGGAGQLKILSPKKSDTDGFKVPGTREAVSSTSGRDKATQQHDIGQNGECNEAIPSDRTIAPPISNIMFQKCLAPVPESKSETSDASPISTSLLDCSGQMNVLARNHMDIQTLQNMEELQDKELEAAQEHRRRCELEERDALKAYRKAQRALIEANANCNYLYRKRDLFSAQFQASLMEDSSASWPSRWQKHTEAGLNTLIPDADTNPFPTLNNQMQSEFEFLNRLCKDSNVQCTDGANPHAYSQQIRGHNSQSEPCSDPDASTSELLHHKGNNSVDGVGTPSNRTNVSADDDEETPVFDGKSERHSSVEKAQDYALLEASLRSELFARLGTNTLSKHSDVCSSKEHTGNKEVEALDKNKNDDSRRNQQSSETEQEQMSDMEGNAREEKGICCSSIVNVHNQTHDDNCAVPYESPRVGDPEECSSSLAEVCRSTASIFFIPSSVLKLVFSHTKVNLPSSFTGSQMRTSEKNLSAILHEDGSDLVGDSLRGMREMGSYTCDLVIDPNWPICMFELRGKCNDEKCPWQHFKENGGRNIKQQDHSANADSDIRISSHAEKVSGGRSLSKCHWKYSMSAPQMYLVGLDLLKADSHTAGSVLGRSIGQYRQKGFSTSSAVPFIVQRNCLSDVRLSHGSDRRLGCQKPIRPDVIDPEQLLELALILFSGDANKLEGKKKALPILSRALEAEPTSATLWIVYLHIHYWDGKTIGKDDMFSLAIRKIESSYGLWLMYIDSRGKLDDCLVAYETAISALCRHASAPDRDRVNASACILDLFLQMLDCLSMSGNVTKAIQSIYGLLPAATGVSYHGSLLLSDILECLTVSDKCIFWVCCVYLVIYKKLPDLVVQQFEVEKDLSSGIEWSSAVLTSNEKHRSLELMKMAVESVASGINSGENEREMHLLAVTHVRCVALLEGMECSTNLLEKYIKLYPSCTELVLASARLLKNQYGDSGYEGFENAIHNWPREVPGIQCIWHHYVRCVLESGEFDSVKQLMVRWSQAFHELDCSQNAKLVDREDDDDLPSSSESPKADACFAFSNPKDEFFALLNLSIHKLLQNDQVEARLAIDKALKVASPEDLRHCVREHAVFVTNDVSEPMEDVPASGILNLLNRYVTDPRILPVCELLSRKFCQNIKKSKSRQLIINLLKPVSCDYTLINVVLEECYGPSLLPQRFGEFKNVVDVVEALMRLFPANYWLGLSVCKLIGRDFNSTGVDSASIAFWASSLLVNCIYQALPVAPERVWVEAADILSDLVKLHVISERFHQHALSVYPFSVKLWKSWHNLCKLVGNESSVEEAARERGIKLD